MKKETFVKVHRKGVSAKQVGLISLVHGSMF